jgi:hypothetical protein
VSEFVLSKSEGFIVQPKAPKLLIGITASTGVQIVLNWWTLEGLAARKARIMPLVRPG